MNKEKAKLLNEALTLGTSPADCNDPEISALLEAGEKIKGSTFNNLAPDADFQERLKAEISARRQTNTFSMKDKISALWEDWRSRLTLRRLAPALAFVVLIAVIVTAVKFWPGNVPSPFVIDAAYAKDNFTVTPTAGGDAGVEADTQFIIKSKVAIKDISTLRSNIKLSPDADFDLKAVSDHEFRLTPKEKLADRRVYKLAIASTYVNESGLSVDHTYSWAFQVKDKFKVVGSTPANRTSAPANTGIEVTFSTENFNGFENAFSIAPTVAGKFEKHKRTMVFVPDKPLATSTLYTVVVNTSVVNTDTNEHLSEPFNLQFEIQSDNTAPSTINFTDDMVEFSTSQSPAMSVFINNQKESQKISTKVYNYRSVADFTAALQKYYEVPNWAYSTRANAEFDYSQISLVSSSDLPISKNDRGDYLVLPNNLPAGFYLLEASLGGSRARIFVQVSDISAYTAVTNNKILFWSNDISSNKPVEAKITDLNTKTVTTSDASGVATIDAASSATTTATALYAVEFGGKTLIVSVPPSYSAKNSDDPSNTYWSYLYTDRSLYQPKDEINFWGFIKPRSGQADTANREITVHLTNDSLFDYYFEPMVIVEKKVMTDSQGFFIGTLKLDNLSPSNYRLQIQLDGKDLYTGRYVNVQEYIKPAYEIKVTPSAHAIFAGEKFKYQIQASFFEGTALANTNLAVEHRPEQGQVENTTITTDAKGSYNLEYTPSCSCQGDQCSDNCYDVLSVTPQLAENAEISGDANISIFRTHIHFDNSTVERIGAENRARIKTKLFNTDLTKEDNNWNGAPVGGKQVNVKITSVEYIPRQTGTYYDFINKLTFPVYTYDEKRTELPAQSFTTSADGSGTLDFAVNPKFYYIVHLTATDQFNNTTNGYVYFNAIYNTTLDPRYEYYNFVEDEAHNTGYTVGETVKLSVLRNNQDPVSSGRFLYFRLQNGLRDYNVSTAAKYSFLFGDSDIPNVYVAGAWFDGHTYHEAGMFNAYFDRAQRQLNITVQTDKEKYRPGEEANLNITVKDKTGRGVKTHVNISAVDAAMAALDGIAEPTPLVSLYKSVDSGLYLSEFSHKNAMFGGGAERGGGGGGGRSYFPDLALFTQVETGDNGTVSVKFPLPDNVTSWQISTQAISGNLEAGATTTKLKATLPFFVEANLSKQYLVGDEPLVKATAFGESLTSSDQVKTYLEAPAIGITSITKEVPAFTPAYFSLGKLRSGDYQLKIGASYKENQDAVIKPTTVIDSLLSERSHTATELKVGGQIAGSDKNWTTVTLLDNNRGRYYVELLGLSYSDGARVDQKLSSVVAAKLMNDYFSDNNEAASTTLKVYQTADGGISLLPYSSTDLKISVMAAMTAPDSFDAKALAGYFYGIYNNENTNRDEMALALSGLAALNEPVLIPLREFSRVPDLKPLDKLYLGLGAKLLGDDQLAQSIYNDLITHYGEQLNPYLRLKIDEKNNDDNSIATALASILAAGVGDSRAESLSNYAQSNLPQDYLTNLERLLYLRQAIPNVPAADSKFTIKVGDKEITKELKKGDSYLLKVSPDQLKNLTISAVSGNVLAVSDYDGAADISRQNKALAITKSYLNKGKETTNFKESDIVEIRLKPKFDGTAIDGAYEISDLLPSGLKLLTSTYSRNQAVNCSVWYPYTVEGQKVKFIIDKNWNKSGDCKREYISYFARVSQPGKYIVEPALLQSTKAVEMKSFSTSGQINISQ